ncbi:hypothetical protein LTR22_004076 [Elasticomyces elasticus]|nr:hypothetical protein LTR22_004076 [Elasticomyces elasticus]KAK4931601.1 hypothetical protein LTR49_001991 [Elasticomyces elasticus]KAK5766760.1 hypothetical protein LTS12_003111 [Elasticomyces elasticus]
MPPYRRPLPSQRACRWTHRTTTSTRTSRRPRQRDEAQIFNTIKTIKRMSEKMEALRQRAAGKEAAFKEKVEGVDELKDKGYKTQLSEAHVAFQEIDSA